MVVINIMLITDEKSVYSNKSVINKKLIRTLYFLLFVINKILERGGIMKKEKLLKGYKQMLYIVDMVKGFVTTGSLHDEDIGRCIPVQIDFIEKFLNLGEGVSFIKDCHDVDSSEFNDFPSHCVKGTIECEMVDQLKKYEDDVLVYEKNSTSAIFAPSFMDDIEKMKSLKEVVAGGCCTDICVMNLLIPLKNYFNQNDKDIDIYVVKSMTDTFNSDFHNRDYYNEVAYDLMSNSGIVVCDDYDDYVSKSKIKERRI